ncbi:MAG: hypothetical protein JEZ09_08545 [Salinivirgaceae bacterium]|nr:hypothetical protein [Salinivirgaceae bacterium]
MKKLLVLFFIINCALLIATAQTKQEQKLIKLYDKEQYLKCLQIAEADIDVYSSEISVFFKLICINSLKKDAYVKTKYPDLTKELFSLLTKIKTSEYDSDFLHTYKSESKRVQKTITYQIKHLFANNNEKLAEQYSDKLLELFNETEGFFQLKVDKELLSLIFIEGEKNIEKQQVNEGIHYYNKLIAYLQDNIIEIPDNVLTEMQRSLFNSGKIFYENEDFEKADLCFNHIYNVFYKNNLNYLYGFPEEYKDKLFSFEEYNNPKYHLADVGKSNDLLSSDEKELYFYINIFRIEPQLFLKTYIKKHVQIRDSIIAQKQINYCSYNLRKEYIDESIGRIKKIERLKILTVQKENKNIWSCKTGTGYPFSLDEQNNFIIISLLLFPNVPNVLLMNSYHSTTSCTGESYFTLKLIKESNQKTINITMGRYE